MSQSTLRPRDGDWDWPNRPFEKYTQEQHDQAREMAEAGYTRSEVAEALGIKYSTLSRWTALNGWQWATRHKRTTRLPVTCDACKHPRKAECIGGRRPCFYEKVFPWESIYRQYVMEA